MNIFEALDNKFDLKEKIKNLSRLFLEKNYFVSGGYYTTFDDYFNDHYFRKWKYSYGCYDLQEFKDKIGLPYSYNFMDRNDIFFYPENEVSAVNFLQYVYNATKFVRDSMYKETGHISSDIQEFYDIFNNQFNYILSKISQKLIKDPKENYYIIVPSNNKTTRCANIQDKNDTAFLLYEYTSSLLIGNVARKREILKLLANEIEPVVTAGLAKYNSGPVHDVFFELSSCLNNFNIRHNNLDPRKPKYYHKKLLSFTDNDYEEIYDVAYDLILDAYLLDEYSNKTKNTYAKYKTKAGL